MSIPIEELYLKDNFFDDEGLFDYERLSYFFIGYRMFTTCDKDECPYEKESDKAIAWEYGWELAHKDFFDMKNRQLRKNKR